MIRQRERIIAKVPEASKQIAIFGLSGSLGINSANLIRPKIPTEIQLIFFTDNKVLCWNC